MDKSRVLPAKYSSWPKGKAWPVVEHIYHRARAHGLSVAHVHARKQTGGAFCDIAFVEPYVCVLRQRPCLAPDATRRTHSLPRTARMHTQAHADVKKTKVDWQIGTRMSTDSDTIITTVVPARLSRDGQNQTDLQQSDFGHIRTEE